MVTLGVVARLYVLTSVDVFLSILFYYVQSITFAWYDFCGFLCTSKCVKDINRLNRLQWAKFVLGLSVVLLSLRFLSLLVDIHMLLLSIGVIL